MRAPAEPTEAIRSTSRGVIVMRTYLLVLAHVGVRCVVYIAAACLAYGIFGKLCRIDLRAEMVERRNWGVAILLGSLFLGLAYIVGQM